jgi:hypothetical protein
MAGVGDITDAVRPGAFADRQRLEIITQGSIRNSTASIRLISHGELLARRLHGATTLRPRTAIFGLFLAEYRIAFCASDHHHG